MTPEIGNRRTSPDGAPMQYSLIYSSAAAYVRRSGRLLSFVIGVLADDVGLSSRFVSAPLFLWKFTTSDIAQTNEHPLLTQSAADAQKSSVTFPVLLDGLTSNDSHFSQ